MLTGRQAKPKPTILMTGAVGQVGQESVTYLRQKYGPDCVVASDVRSPPRELLDSGTFLYLDVTDFTQVARVVLEQGITTIVHLAALLSATGESNPQLALRVNVAGVSNVLEVARLHNLRVFIPSTIAVFGPSTPTEAPDMCPMRPTTMYGVTKVHMELLGEYYHQKYAVDFRSLRYPGVISSKAMPGGGTTDYAVEIYHDALVHGRYTCFLEADTLLPMVYMPDLMRASDAIMRAPDALLTHRVYNLASMSFTPRMLAKSIQKQLPHFQMEYAPDFRQAIAASWPQRLNDSAARADWGWMPEYDLDSMTESMLRDLRANL